MIKNEIEYQTSKKLLEDLLKSEAETIQNLQARNFDPEQIDIILQPLICFRLGVEEELREFERRHA